MINKISGYQTYGLSYSQEEAIFARQTDDVEAQRRIAENSEHRLVLLNLTMNPNLDNNVVQVLFNRDLDYITDRLENLGYKKTLWNILF